MTIHSSIALGFAFFCFVALSINPLKLDVNCQYTLKFKKEKIEKYTIITVFGRNYLKILLPTFNKILQEQDSFLFF